MNHCFLSLAPAVMILSMAAGCISSQRLETPPAPGPTTTAPAVGSPPSSSAQQGWLNAAVQGITGLVYNTTLPWGAVAFLTVVSLSDKAYMALLALLRHRRKLLPRRLAHQRKLAQIRKQPAQVDYFSRPGK